MQLVINETKKNKTLKDITVSIPNSMYTSKIFGKDIEIDKCYSSGSFKKLFFTEMLTQQHPLISTWLVLSSVSICFLSALLFMFN